MNCARVPTTAATDDYYRFENRIVSAFRLADDDFGRTRANPISPSVADGY